MRLPSDATMRLREVRFVVEEDVTHAYVLIETESGTPIGVQGWHHKTFPASRSIADIVAAFRTDWPVSWPLNAPVRKRQ